MKLAFSTFDLSTKAAHSGQQEVEQGACKWNWLELKNCQTPWLHSPDRNIWKASDIMVHTYSKNIKQQKYSAV